MRTIPGEIPKLDELGLPPILRQVAMEKRGLVIFVGTGSGKSTSLAAMIVSPRLIPRKGMKGRVAAVEVMLNTPLMADLIFKGAVHEMKPLIEKSQELGMKSFDQALFELYESDQVTLEDALRNADSMNDLRVRIKFKSKRSDGPGDGLPGMELVPPKPQA